MNWDLIANIMMVCWTILIGFILYILFREHNKNKDGEGCMGYNLEEDKQSEYLALKDNLVLLKEEIDAGHLKQAKKRINYILVEQMGEQQ